MSAAPPILRARPARRVCVVLLSGIGDVVHGLPLANDLRRNHPELELLWVAEPSPARVLEHHPAVDRILVFEKSRGLGGVADLFRGFRGRTCDVTLNMQRYFKSVFPTLLSRAPVRVGLPRSITRDAVSWFNTHHLPDGPWRHTQDLFLEYRPILGLPGDAPVEWCVTFSGEEEEAREDFFGRLERPVVGLVPATANPAKDWLPGRWVELSDALQDRGFTVLLVGGPSAAEREVAARLVREGRGGVVDGLGDSVRRMMWMVDAVDLLVSPDTGPLHLAHALETPVVGLYGHTNPWRVGPWRRYRDLIVDRYTDPDAEPDPSTYEPREGRMERIEAADVLERVELARVRYLESSP